MKNNRGNISFAVILFGVIVLLFLIFLGTALFEIITIGEFHEIKNDLYLINRNVLMALSRDIMGEDINAFYEDNVKELIAEEIKRLWNIDVSCDLGQGRFIRVDINSAKIINEDDKMYIESELNIKLRPVILGAVLKDSLNFTTMEKVKVEKMRR